MSIRLDNLAPLQKYLCSFNIQRAPKIAGARLHSALKADTFTKSANQGKMLEQILYPDMDKLYILCNYLHNQGKKSFETYKNIFEETFADILQNGGELKGRVKSTNSIYNKLIKRGGFCFNNMERFYKKTPDTCGYKLVTNGTPEDMEKAVQQIEKLTKNGTLTPVSVLNRGQNPYLNSSQTERLIQHGFEVKNTKTPGLNNINILFKDKKGKMLELQITGKETENLSAKEHPFYKFKQKLRYKMPTEATDDNGKSIDDLTLKFRLLKSENLLDEYSNYIDECYSYARSLELGIPAKRPVLPENIREIFDYANKFLASNGAKFTSPTEFYQ